ncbi:hypothetical protein [Jiangella asiatica]|uniref:Uncharacterized protein n=1 Tax=Jiangella asiatica TaxID=2530372 RepID=A0A4R5DPW2_9ACTN|nr:hypothetical protein [Jiangella asiatica]TDE13025.1 hypothetical protein E1269_06430 [Jiangella asiatica]
MSADTRDPGRRPPPRLGLAWYALALMAYVVAGYFYKPVLMNWTLGPLFLLAALYVVPTVGRAAWSRLRTGQSS